MSQIEQRALIDRVAGRIAENRSELPGEQALVAMRVIAGGREVAIARFGVELGIAFSSRAGRDRTCAKAFPAPARRIPRTAAEALRLQFCRPIFTRFIAVGLQVRFRVVHQRIASGFH
jgi:hypothetical protein